MKEDKNWKDGVYNGPTNAKTANQLEQYKKHVEELIKTNKEVTIPNFSEWRTNNVKKKV